MAARPVTADAAWTTVHAPLAHWAACRPDAIAIDDGAIRLSFRALAAGVDESVRVMRRTGGRGPMPRWVDDAATPGAQLVQFLGIVAAGDAAVVGDPDWSSSVRRQVEALTGNDALQDDTFYVGFTSGSTGMPKGYVRSHASWTSSFAACLDAFGPGAETSLLAPGRLSHSLFLFAALLGIWTGAGVRLQSRFSAAAALQALQDGESLSLMAVPSQLVLMLEHAQRHRLPPIAWTRQVTIGGAAWPRARTPQLRALFPQARIVEFYGASETSFIAWTDSDPLQPASVVGRPFGNVALRIDPIAPTATDAAVDATMGRIYVRSPMVFTRYLTPQPAHGPGALLRDGDWLSIGDVGRLDADGVLHLAGRQQRMFVVQGKNLFPEEVEQVLAAHPAITSVSVQATEDAVRGVSTVAVLELAQAVDRRALVAWCRERLEAYKAPRRFHACETPWPRTASGKTDHAAIARLLAAHPDGPDGWLVLPWERR